MDNKIDIRGLDLAMLFGPADSHLRIIEDSFEVKTVIRNDTIKISGDEIKIALAKEIIHEMKQTLGRKGSINLKDVKQLIEIISVDNGQNNELPKEVIHYGRKGAIVARSKGQHTYINIVNNNDIVLSVGPAGTGKTYIAVAFAIAALENSEVDRIVLCRPAVEAGESLGFLPGDLKEKVDPYLTPLYDALGDIMPKSKLKKVLSDGTIEIVPLAYMRGRTLNNAFMILDEAQNATPMQMKMFLTRLGVNSKAIITGDITQVDLPLKTDSGLIQVVKILKGIDGIGFVKLTESDVVRHKLVKDIILAYDKSTRKKTKN
ncbi:MAG: PhoH family protein [Candidatus Neomarinimicrobiota bacterium]|nr:phosphate starvation-inducible protein PhoH [Candidatus Neomarinimicrobiota bacterium]MEC7935087.1 PhoH family protein [Candidatus Neomarinimicrobiota bacterium]MEC9027415.1 PhoH family protein [Candidatus Neomarinimicrobiota bacterium]MED5256675.1 PhoH family protein [Candidatus Neomarinimicrobiota bacterium]MED5266024.1 PhoH family protein [Candidatus Neomarinimicrobiota bacterium]|tara:strand:- start:85 stop:1038 length:954 start_codon:yes stop_codon:yes gene_type:complete